MRDKNNSHGPQLKCRREVVCLRDVYFNRDVQQLVCLFLKYFMFILQRSTSTKLVQFYLYASFACSGPSFNRFANLLSVSTELFCFILRIFLTYAHEQVNNTTPSTILLSHVQIYHTTVRVQRKFSNRTKIDYVFSLEIPIYRKRLAVLII